MIKVITILSIVTVIVQITSFTLTLDNQRTKREENIKLCKEIYKDTLFIDRESQCYKYLVKNNQ